MITGKTTLAEKTLIIFDEIQECNEADVALAAYDDLSAFKIYLSDVGLLRRLSALDPIAIREGNRLFVEFKGALTENYVLQSLISQFEVTPRYYRKRWL